MACQLVAAGLAYFHAKKFGDSATSFGVHISWKAIVNGWHGVSAVHVKLWPLALIPVVAGMAAYRLRTRGTITAWLSALGMIPAIISMTCLPWVQLNDYDTHYYLIFVITFAACCSYVLARSMRMPEKTRSSSATSGMSGRPCSPVANACIRRDRTHNRFMAPPFAAMFYAVHHEADPRPRQ
jgi:hypothetical protein